MAKFSTQRFAVAVLAFGCTGLYGAAALALPKFTDWSVPQNIETLPESGSSVNTPATDGCVSLSRDGLSLYYNSNRTGNQDIYVAYRSDKESGFGNPERLPFPINTGADEFCPTSDHGNLLYFSRASSGDPGDLYVSQEGPRGWIDPESLGDEINSPLMDEAATFYEDERGIRVMLFSRRQANGTGGNIFVSIEGSPAMPIGGGPDSSASDNRPSITHDGLTLFFDSTRGGGLGGPDIWVATRGSTTDLFGAASNLQTLNSGGFDARPSVSWDGTELFFSSIRAGNNSAAGVPPLPDIWRASRKKAKGGPKTVTM